MLRRRIDVAQLEVRPLSLQDRPSIDGFSCSDADLDDFVRSDAFRLQAGNIVQTYLAFYGGTVAGYVSLLSDAIVLATRERKRLALSVHDHPIVPALKIARLGISAEFRQSHRGLGEALVGFAFATAADIAELVGCRLLTVDAYPQSVGFYERLGFVFNRAKPYQEKLHPSMRFDLFAPKLPSWATVGMVNDRPDALELAVTP